jgi:hypothetical protein
MPCLLLLVWPGNPPTRLSKTLYEPLSKGASFSSHTSLQESGHLRTTSDSLFLKLHSVDGQGVTAN